VLGALLPVGSVCEELKRLTTSFLNVVGFFLVTPLFQYSICGVLTSRLALVSSFFFFLCEPQFLRMAFQNFKPTI